MPNLVRGQRLALTAPHRNVPLDLHTIVFRSLVRTLLTHIAMH